MPTYTYACKKCGHAFDIFHAMSANPRVKCEVCKGVCQRQIGTGSGIIFKGSGFYETDFKEKKGTKPAEAGASGNGNGSDKGAEKGGKKEGAKEGAKASESSKSEGAAKKEPAKKPAKD